MSRESWRGAEGLCASVSRSSMSGGMGGGRKSVSGCVFAGRHGVGRVYTFVWMRCICARMYACGYVCVYSHGHDIHSVHI